MSIIKVENLSKKYIIGHDRNAGSAYRYRSLRDTVAHTARGFYQRLRHPLSPNTENTEIEEFWALKDLNFEIEPGDRVGIIGRNGAGKSTLLKILSRITEPTTGRIEIGGRVASLLEVGTGFHPELTGRENIYLNGAILGMTRTEIRRSFDEIVAFAEVEKFLDTPVKRYSSGMYVRLGFAIAAHLEAEILIVDEVLAVGDASFQNKCLGKMEDVSKEGRTVLFVSHNMAAIENLCQTGLLIEQGGCTRHETVDAAITSYVSLTKPLTATKDLLKIVDREGNGDAKFCSWELLGAGDNTVSSFCSGERATIRLEVNATPQAAGKALTIAVGLDNVKGHRVCHFASETISSEMSVDREKELIDLRIPSLSIMPGVYTCTLFCTVGGQIADWIQSAFSFEVTAGDFYGSGRLPPLGQGDFLMRYQIERRTR